MPVMFVLALICFTTGVIAAPIAIMTQQQSMRRDSRTTAIWAIAVGALFVVGASVNFVPIRNIGIVTSFSKPTGDITGSGLNWVAPWKKIGEWDASRQKYDHVGAKKAVNVRTATLANAGVELLIEWQVRPESAPRQFVDYKGDFKTFRSQRVGVQLDGAVNDAFATYSPLAGLDAKGNLNVDLKPFAERVKALAQERLSNDVEILTVTIIRVNHDEQTEANIKAFQDKIAQGRNLDQDLINAQKQLEVTRKNAEADRVIRCLEIAERNGTNPGWCLNPGIEVSAK